MSSKASGSAGESTEIAIINPVVRRPSSRSLFQRPGKGNVSQWRVGRRVGLAWGMDHAKEDNSFANTIQ